MNNTEEIPNKVGKYQRASRIEIKAAREALKEVVIRAYNKGSMKFAYTNEKDATGLLAALNDFRQWVHNNKLDDMELYRIITLVSFRRKSKLDIEVVRKKHAMSRRTRLCLDLRKELGLNEVEDDLKTIVESFDNSEII